MLCVECSLEEPQESCQTKAVHVVYLGQITDDKEQPAAILCQGEVSVSFLFNECRYSTFLFHNNLGQGSMEHPLSNAHCFSLPVCLTGQSFSSSYRKTMNKNTLSATKPL